MADYYTDGTYRWWHLSVPSDTRLLEVLVVRLWCDQNLARTPSATSSGLTSIMASPQMRSK
jgi:hypothetical protein